MRKPRLFANSLVFLYEKLLLIQWIRDALISAGNVYNVQFNLRNRAQVTNTGHAQVSVGRVRVRVNPGTGRDW